MKPVAPSVHVPYNLAFTRMNQAIGQAFWIIDAKWPKTWDAPHAVIAANESWSELVEGIRAADCEYEEKTRRLHLLIADIRREK